MLLPYTSLRKLKHRDSLGWNVSRASHIQVIPEVLQFNPKTDRYKLPRLCSPQSRPYRTNGRTPYIPFPPQPLSPQTNPNPRPQHDARYAQAEEYMTVIYKLLQSSWADNAVLLDRTKGLYTSPSLIRPINHSGPYYTVPGPQITQPSPQRTPLLLQAGASKAGKLFAAQHAEAIFTSAHSPAVCKKNIAEIREMAREKFGRGRGAVKVLALVTPILGRTEEEALRKEAELRKYASTEVKKKVPSNNPCCSIR